MRERFLPAEAASLGGDHIRQPFLHDVQFGPARHLLQRDRRLHLAGQVRGVEFVRVADAFVWHQFEVRAAEGVALTGREVRKARGRSCLTRTGLFEIWG